MITRRSFLKGALGATASALLPVAHASVPGSAVALVELINFGCGRCRAMEAYSARIQAAAASRNVVFRVAPVAWTSQSLWPDRVYYAARDLYPGLEVAVRGAFFTALQRDGQRLEDLPQAIAYLESDPGFTSARANFPGFSLAALAEYANGDEPLIAEMRAIRLLEGSGVQELPGFVWVADGEIAHRDSPANGDVDGLFSRILATFNKESNSL